jgi:transposase
MINQIQGGFNQIEELVLVLDKGNNSKENFADLKGKIKWVGSLVPTHFADLIDLPLSQYSGEWEALRYYRCDRKVMGIECVLVMSYNDKLYRKQELKLKSEIEKLKQKVIVKWSEYKRTPRSVPAGIKSLVKDSRYGKYIDVRCEEGKPAFELCSSQIAESRKRFGKNLLFCSELEAESGWIISQYKSKQRIEEDFKLVKDPELIRWQPIRHWTDTKIFAFGFCCVMGLVVIRIMQLKASREGMEMSPAVLKEELADLQEVVMIYDQKHAETKITSRSSIQQRLWELFELGRIETKLIS